MAVTVLACGTWDAVAAAVGPLAPPLPQALGIGGLVLSVPWWANRRRRAKVRVARTIATWPDIARAVGLAGSEIMSATVDLWGWRARLRLARGQTITDVMAKVPALESGFGTHRNAIRVYPTPDDLANRCELRVLDHDPHADAVPWHGPSVTSITQPIDLGPFEDAEPCRVLFLRRHAIVGGATGSGKSGGLNELLANLAACGDVVIWAIDLKRGVELRPWAPCIDRLATTPAEAAALLADAVTILFARAQCLADHGKREWQPSPAMPALVIIIDEYAELADDAPDAMSDTDTIARLGRAPAVTLIAATQRPTQKVMGQGAVRSQMNIRICVPRRRTTRRRPHPRTGQAQGRLARPQAQRPRQVPHLGTRARHPPPRTRLPRHRRRRDGHGRALRGHPPPARQHLTPCPSRRVAATSAATPGAPSPDHRAARPDDADAGEPPAADEQQDPDAILQTRAVRRTSRRRSRQRPHHGYRHEPAVGLLPATPARRRRLRRPDGTRLLAHREMTIRNRECKVQVHALTRVCTYSGIISACTCTKPDSPLRHQP